ncbi:MAG: hypothetical protein J1G01_03875 [Clostridiales bacterium]|nr:hypothetical protein [Clostridiales bacterium]
MKRSAKILIVALAIAIVFGIGTVSFAKWTVASSSTATAEGPTGKVNTVGNVVVTVTSGGSGSSTNKNIKMNKLLPYDNNDIQGTKYWQFSVSVTGNAGDVNVTLTGAIDCDTSVAKLYFSQTAPGATASTNELPNGTDKSITLSNNQATVYVYMIAYSVAAMNTDISLTFTATAA